jgi:cation diffusion facilitator family transporter
MAAHSQEKPVTVYGAIAANLLIAISKFVAAFFTGSSSMLSEGIHSLADTGNEGLLLLGVHRSDKKPDASHPFGYGQELYFWSLIVAMILFGLGGGMSLYEGITHILNPRALEDPLWNYVTLALAVLFEGASFLIALRALLRAKGRDTIWQAVHTSKDPTVFVVLFEDAAALVGLALAFLGVYLSHRLNEPRLDGVASILIGLVLAAVSMVLAYESKGLLLGESADPATVQKIQQLVTADRDVRQARKPLTMHLGPQEVLVNLDVEFRPGLTSGELAAAVDRLEQKIRASAPQVTRIFIEAEALAQTERGVPVTK